MAEPGFLFRRAAATLPRETALGLPVRTGPLTMRHFYIRAETGKAVGRSPEQIDDDYRRAAALANLAAPYRHSRLSAVKLAGDPNSPARFKDDATADELRAEIIKRLTALSEAGVLDLTAVPVPEDGIGNRPLPSVDQSDMNGK